jgi:hypothetical protein
LRPPSPPPSPPSAVSPPPLPSLPPLLLPPTIDCPCIDAYPEARVNTSRNVATINGMRYDYPLAYGLSNCSAHDVMLPPYCDSANATGYDPKATSIRLERGP